MSLDMRVKKGENGWNGIFIPGDSALFGSDHLEAMANYLESDTEYWVPIVAKWLRDHASKLRACRQAERHKD
jgi:hypothetical protein